jgi:hypothetical protein
MSQEIRQLGQTYKEITTWIWLTVFLFWLLFPPIVLLIKQFQLASNMKAAGEANNDQQLIAFGDRELLIIILNLLSSITGITGLIAVILQIIQLGELKDWAMNRKIPHAADGYSSVRTGILIAIFLGWLIIPAIIGLIMVTSGYNKIGNALLH